MHRGERKSWAIRSIGAGEAGEQVLGFQTDKDDVEAFGFAGAQGINRSQDLVERLAGEKEEGGKGVILGRGGDPLVSCQVGEERFDFGDAHVPGVAFVMERDEPFDPVDRGLFSPDGGVFEAQRIPDPVQQFPGFGSISSDDKRRFLCYDRWLSAQSRTAVTGDRDTGQFPCMQLQVRLIRNPYKTPWRGERRNPYNQ